VTIDEIRQSDKTMLTPTDIAPILGCHPYSLNVAAKADIKALGFPASLIGTRLRIPRVGFLRWFDGQGVKT
jgi:hypothetical protein